MEGQVHESGIAGHAAKTWCVTTALLILLLGLVWAPFANAQTVVAMDVAEDATEANSQPKIGADSHGRVYLAFEKPAGGYWQILVAPSPDSLGRDRQQASRAGAHA